MKFTDEQLDNFIALYEKEFGEKLERDEALRQAVALISLVDRLYKPMTKSEYDKYYLGIEK